MCVKTRRVSSRDQYSKGPSSLLYRINVTALLRLDKNVASGQILSFTRLVLKKSPKLLSGLEAYCSEQ